jgi:hypothetical protein
MEERLRKTQYRIGLEDGGVDVGCPLQTSDPHGAPGEEDGQTEQDNPGQ